MNTLRTAMRQILLAAVIALMPIPAIAQDYEKGLAAARAGDYATALKEWRPLAEQGNAQAQSDLGFMYANGLGMPQDHAEAMRWYRLAADQGFAPAQYNLGVMYRDGEGVPQNYEEAARLFRLAAEQGDTGAQNNIGIMYLNGFGVVRDHVAAFMWFNIAAAIRNEQSSEVRDRVAEEMTVRTDRRSSAPRQGLHGK